MSAAHAQSLDLTAPPVIKNIGRRSMLVALVFALASIAGVFFAPDEFYQAYLLAYMACLGVTLGSMAILMVRHLTGGGWGMVMGRILEAAMRCLPLMTLLFLPLLGGFKGLYVWARPLEQIADVKLREHLEHITQTYLNQRGFIIRAIIYLAIWNLLAFLLSRFSAAHDRPPLRSNGKAKVLSGPGLILYAFSISFAAIDWVMSIDPSWISTIYGLLILIGQVLAALCLAIIVERTLVRYRPMSELLRPSFVHDHGKWMLAFIMVWAYFSFSQWLIIWAGNLPEEITWYTKRLAGGWGAIGLLLALFHFVVPFAMLLSRPFKRDITRLVWLAAWLLFMRFVDLFWIIEPNFSSGFRITWLEIVVPVAMGALWLTVFCRNLASRPLLALYDMDAREVLEPAHEH